MFRLIVEFATSLMNGATSSKDGGEESMSPSKRSKQNLGEKGTTKNRLAKFKMFQSWGIVLQDETVTFV
jgi:hypothetical protein